MSKCDSPGRESDGRCSNVDETWNLKDDQGADEDIKPVLDVMRGGQRPHDLSGDAKLLLREKKKLYLDDEGILKRRYNGIGQVVLPKKRREHIYKHYAPLRHGDTWEPIA